MYMRKFAKLKKMNSAFCFGITLSNFLYDNEVPNFDELQCQLGNGQRASDLHRCCAIRGNQRALQKEALFFQEGSTADDARYLHLQLLMADLS